MKTASRVFIIIGLVCSIILLISYFIYPEMGIFYLIYGIYSLVMSIICLCAVSGRSKTGVIVAGIFYIPVMLIASIFMFCIKSRDLY